MSEQSDRCTGAGVGARAWPPGPAPALAAGWAAQHRSWRARVPRPRTSRPRASPSPTTAPPHRRRRRRGRIHVVERGAGPAGGAAARVHAELGRCGRTSSATWPTTTGSSPSTCAATGRRSRAATASPWTQAPVSSTSPGRGPHGAGAAGLAGRAPHGGGRRTCSRRSTSSTPWWWATPWAAWWPSSSPTTSRPTSCAAGWPGMVLVVDHGRALRAPARVRRGGPRWPGRCRPGPCSSADRLGACAPWRRRTCAGG